MNGLKLILAGHVAKMEESKKTSQKA
jgi:hypothetical protein